jgi:hypothetical protein
VSRQWTGPEPRTGIAGYWDRFVGPGATDSELLLAFLGALAAAAAVPLYARTAGIPWTALQYAVAAFLAFDLVGGVVTNATQSAKRWYHRPGQGTRDHLAFVAVHGLHIALATWLFRGADWFFFLLVYGGLLLGAVIVLTVPLYLQRPVALLCVCVAFFLGLYGVAPTPGLEWFVPLLFLKLLVSHLVHEFPHEQHRRNRPRT